MIRPCTGKASMTDRIILTVRSEGGDATGVMEFVWLLWFISFLWLVWFEEQKNQTNQMNQST